MNEYTWERVTNLAGIYDQDSALERDLKFECWINQRKYIIVTGIGAQQQREWAQENGIEILIIKE